MHVYFKNCAYPVANVLCRLPPKIDIFARNAFAVRFGIAFPLPLAI